MASVKFAGFPKGMDNVHADTEIPEGAARRIVNFDVLDSGKLRRRTGSEQTVAAAGAHSLWSDGRGPGYFIAANRLHRFNGAGAVDIGAVAADGEPVAWCRAPTGAAYFTGRNASGCVVGDVLSPWGIETPHAPPLMMPDTGTLDPGTYLAVITYVRADGRESGASLQASYELASRGGLAFFGLPVPTQADVVAKRIYLTAADSETFYHVATVPAADAVAFMGTPGAELRGRYLSAPPRGTALAYALGRIFIADGPTVWFTEALDFDRVDRRKSFYRFPADVTLVAGTKDGLYVCADQTYFLPAAGTAESGQRAVLPFGAIAGTLAAMPTTGDPIWFTERGAVIGKDGGQVEIVSEASVSPGRISAAAGMVRERDGLRQFVAVGSPENASPIQAGSYAEAEIIRRAKQ